MLRHGGASTLREYMDEGGGEHEGGLVVGTDPFAAVEEAYEGQPYSGSRLDRLHSPTTKQSSSSPSSRGRRHSLASSSSPRNKQQDNLSPSSRRRRVEQIMDELDEGLVEDLPRNQPSYSFEEDHHDGTVGISSSTRGSQQQQSAAVSSSTNLRNSRSAASSLKNHAHQRRRTKQVQSILNELEDPPRNSHSFESRRKVDSILSTLDGEEGEEDELNYTNPQQQQQQQQDSFAGKDPRRRSQQPQMLQQPNYLPPPPRTPPPPVMDDSHGFRSRPHTATAAGPMSPFSPLFHRRKRPRPAVVSGMQQHVGWKDDVDDDNQEDVMDLSLSICRKVSVVVTVLTPATDDDHHLGVVNNKQRQQEQQQVCLFPMRAAAAGETSPRDLMIVNPTALGQHIPVQMTMETARLLSETTANTTDWARTYKFHQVVWQQPSNNANSDNDNDAAATEALRNISQAVTNDMQAPGSIAHRILIGMGSHVVGAGSSSSTEQLFGVVGNQSVARVLSSATQPLNTVEMVQRYGLVGLTAQNLLQQQQQKRRQTQSVVCTLSVLEVQEEEVLYDLLASKPFARSGPRVRIRYGAAGAMVVGLSETPLDSLKHVGHLLRRAFSAALHPNRKSRRGHIVVALSLFNKKDPTKRTSCQFVDLAVVDPNDDEDSNPAVIRHNAAIRKSVSALGTTLRAALLNEAGNDTPISYRDTLLTKVLQKSMVQTDSRVIVLATVSPIAGQYEETMETLRYVNRLLHRQGQPLQSPFKSVNDSSFQDVSSPITTASTEPISLDQFDGQQQHVLLQELISDPRQRLARLLKPSFSSAAADVEETPLEPDGYSPTEYANPLEQQRDYESSVESSYVEPKEDPPVVDQSPTPLVRNGEQQQQQQQQTKSPFFPDSDLLFVGTGDADDDDDDNDDDELIISPNYNDGVRTTTNPFDDDVDGAAMDQNRTLDDVAAQMAQNHRPSSSSVSDDHADQNDDDSENNEVGEPHQGDRHGEEVLEADFGAEAPVEDDNDPYEAAHAHDQTEEVSPLSSRLDASYDDYHGVVTSQRSNDSDVLEKILREPECEEQGTDQYPTSDMEQQTDDKALEKLLRETDSMQTDEKTLEKLLRETGSDRSPMKRSMEQSENAERASENRSRTVEQSTQRRADVVNRESRIPKPAQRDRGNSSKESFDRLENMGRGRANNRAADLDMEMADEPTTTYDVPLDSPAVKSADQTERIERATKEFLAAGGSFEEKPNARSPFSFTQNGASDEDDDIDRWEQQEAISYTALSVSEGGKQAKKDSFATEAWNATPSARSAFSSTSTEDDVLVEDREIDRPEKQRTAPTSAQVETREQEWDKDLGASQTQISYRNDRDALQEIDQLQAAVDKVKQTNMSVWKSSLTSIDNLRQYQTSQQQNVERLLSERDEAEKARESLEAEIDRLAEQHRLEMETRGQEVEQAHSEIQKIKDERSEVVKICEEAIGTQAELEEKVTELEEALANRDDYDELAETLEAVQQQSKELEHELSLSKRDIDDRDMTISELKFAARSLEGERNELVNDRSKAQKEIASLKSSLERSREAENEAASSRAEVSRLQKDLHSTRFASQRREAELLRELRAKDELSKRYEQEAERAKMELSAFQAEAGTDALAHRNEINQLREESTQLREALREYPNKLRDSQQLIDDLEAARDGISRELGDTREELNRRISDVKDLSSNMKELLSERESDKARIEQMEKAFTSFQNETRSRVEKVVHHRNEAATLLEKTVKENKALVETNQKLRAALEELRQVRIEGDARSKRLSETVRRLENALKDNSALEEVNRRLSRELEDLRREHRATSTEYSRSAEDLRRGRSDADEREKKLSETASRLETTTKENAALEEANHRLSRELEDLRRNNRAAFTDVSGSHRIGRETENTGDYARTRIGFEGGGRPRSSHRSLYHFDAGSLPDRSETVRRRGSSIERTELNRAEEVAAYLALSAKSRMETTSTQDSHLRQALYDLEDAKDQEINALKSRIKGLERRLG